VNVCKSQPELAATFWISELSANVPGKGGNWTWPKTSISVVFNASYWLQDALALEFAFHLEIGETIPSHDLEFPGFTERDLQLDAEYGGERRLEVGVLIVEAADGDVDLLPRRFLAECAGQILEWIIRREVRSMKEEGKKAVV